MHLDVDLVAMETAAEVAVILDVTAPTVLGEARAAGVALATAQAVSLVIRTADAVPGFTVWNQLPVCGSRDGVVVDLGDFHPGERRRILLTFLTPGLRAATICELEVRAKAEQVATVPVRVT
jgi:hypothetical protein